LFVILSSKSVLAQAPKKIIVEHSDFADVEWSGDTGFTHGNVRVNHDGVVLTVNRAYYFQKKITLKLWKCTISPGRYLVPETVNTQSTAVM
jgi:hypothetical protein